jgi:hypothetical protein
MTDSVPLINFQVSDFGDKVEDSSFLNALQNQVSTLENYFSSSLTLRMKKARPFDPGKSKIFLKKS